MRAYVVVGDPVKGLVGIGHGKGTLAGPAIEQAFYEGRSLESVCYVMLNLSRAQHGRGEPI